MLCCSMKGDWRGALRVRGLMARARVPATVHVYNALLAACERAQQWCAAVSLVLLCVLPCSLGLLLCTALHGPCACSQEIFSCCVPA